ncbi:MAG TPA: MFS transporter [Ktedonobacterales bacterium]
MSLSSLDHTTLSTAHATSPHLRRHALAYALYTLAVSSRFTQAIWVIYLAAHGYSPFAIGLYEMTFHLAKFLAEAPTGVFADLVGRRASLIVACVLSAVAELLYLAPVPPVIFLSFVLSGTSFAFRGGADSAYLWSLAGPPGLAETAARYSKLFSRMFIVMLVGEAIGTSSGGFLSTIGASVPFICQTLLTLAGIAPLLMLPSRRMPREHRSSPLRHLGAGLRAVWRDPILLELLLLSGLLAGVFATVSIYASLFFHTLGFSLSAVGLIFGIAVVPSALYAAVAPRLVARLPRIWLLAGCVLAEALGLLAMASQRQWIAVVGFLLLFYSMDSIVAPALSRYLNERAPEAQRATVLSLDTGLFSAVMIVLFPLFGLGLTNISFGAAYLWVLVALIGGSGLILGGGALLRRARGRRDEQDMA